MKRTVAILAVVILALIAPALLLSQTGKAEQPERTANAPAAYIANPTNYKLLGENDLFLVILETKPVGVRDVWHSHMAGAVYYLTDCHQRVYMPDGTSREATREKGSVSWQSATAHSTENLGTADCVMLVVERK